MGVVGVLASGLGDVLVDNGGERVAAFGVGDGRTLDVPVSDINEEIAVLGADDVPVADVEEEVVALGVLNVPVDEVDDEVAAFGVEILDVRVEGVEDVGVCDDRVFPLFWDSRLL